MGRHWSSGHLPARLEPGSWASPGPSGSTETQRKPPGHVTLCRQGTSGIGLAGGPRSTPYRRIGAQDDQLFVAVPTRSDCPVRRIAAIPVRDRPAWRAAPGITAELDAV